MPDNRDLEQPEDPRLEDDEEIVGIGEDEDEFGDEEEDLEEPIDEEPLGMSSTDEVGSEGGSEGTAEGQSRSGGRPTGSEATEAWSAGKRDRRIVVHRDSTAAPRRRSPS